MDLKWFFIGVIALAIFVGSIDTEIDTEYFENTPLFMTKHQTYRFIREDIDGYITKMPLTVVEERGFPDHENYLRAAAKSALTFSTRDQKFLTSMAPEIDKFLERNYGAKNINKPWIFALTEGQTYELGIPHVRQGVMMLSTHTLDVDLKDDCALAWTLMYLRQNQLFGKPISDSELPWKATERYWMYRRRLPTCRYWDLHKVTPDESDIDAVRIWNKSKNNWDMYMVPSYR